ncbi:hypothetical protein DRE_03816 [Drechslerella stenobrocha 248]|uniref:Hydrophobin n=1 Tax=Drechslerella stenobrocha 248 TaxID=1043628 RepID=W7HUB2_9PEZI|nr:hypothetical protein DRE_03816 [Drechslerella stenobrocha 248]
MQLLTFTTLFLSALSAVSAAPQRGRPGDVTIVPGRIGGTGSAGSSAGSNTSNNGNNNGGNTAIGNPNSDVNQSSTSCANGQVVCCNGPETNTATSNTGRQSSRITYPQYQYLLQGLYRNRINLPTINNNRESSQSNQCTQVTSWESGSSSPICQQTVACCSGIQGAAVANVGCTAMNIVVNTGNSPVNGFFPKE